MRENAGKKWICKAEKESSISVIFQLPKPMKICGIDIGNEYSAFIEILVASSNETCDKDYKHILLTSSLMSVTECRNEENPNRVRCFGKNSLVSDVIDQKWKFIKIVCTQPFNKSVKYGLSFVKIHTPSIEAKNEDIENDNSTTAPMLGFGKFRLRQDSTDSDGDAANSSSLFARWKESKKQSAEKPKTISGNFFFLYF